jgi:hypothetical protein
MLYTSETESMFFPSPDVGGATGLLSTAFVNGSLYRAYPVDYDAVKTQEAKGILEQASLIDSGVAEMTLQKQPAKTAKIHSLRSPNCTINAIAYSP